MTSINKKINIYSKEQIDEKEIGEPSDSASESGSLWARIKNALTRIGILETADTQNVKKNGSTVTGALEVPTTPPNGNSAVNQNYVESTANGVNDIVHKKDAETIQGTKTFYSPNFSEVVIQSSRSESANLGGIGFFNANGIRISQLYANGLGDINLNTLIGGACKALGQRAYNSANTDDIVTIGTLQTSTDVVHTTGAETVDGAKTFANRVIVKASNIDATQPGTAVKHSAVDFRFNDVNNVDLAHIYIQQVPDGRIAVYLVIRNTDGSSKYVPLGTSDVIT